MYWRNPRQTPLVLRGSCWPHCHASMARHGGIADVDVARCSGLGMMNPESESRTGMSDIGHELTCAP